MSPSVQDRTKRSRKQISSCKDSCRHWGFLGQPLKLDRGHSGAYCGHPLKLDWDRGHSGADCGNINWALL